LAVIGEHRTICGLSAIAAPTPELLEPVASGWWIPRLSAGAPFRRGRVWLWPTSATHLAAGLSRALDELRIPLHLSATPTISAAGVVTLADQQWRPMAVIDASGGAWWRDVATRPPRQCGAWRVELELELDEAPASQRAALRRLAPLAPTLALEKISARRWQLSFDVVDADARAASVSASTSATATATASASATATATATAEQAATLLGATIIGHAQAVAERDEGGYAGLGLAELFACRERGLTWAAWPSEVHDAHGVHWQWPNRDRHGCPPALVKPRGAPPWLWCCGKGLAAAPEAAAALRVMGTALALGHALGNLVVSPPANTP
jgi:hypothetical protein